MGLALRQLGEAGRELWHRWSSGSPKYEADVVDAKWDGFAAGAGAGRVTLGTLFHLAKLEGWPGPRRGRRGPASRSSRITLSI